MPNWRRAFAGGAVIALAFFLVLARAVGRAPDPAWLLSIEASWTNHSTLIAWWVTWLGYAYVLGPICLVLLVVAWRSPAWRVQALFSIVALLLCWQGADVAQHLFARPRRLDWVVKRETAFGFPSSHAAIAFGFYGLWALFIGRSAVRYAALIGGALGLLALSICWSRLVLGAHYLTDLVGGALLATAIVCAMAACMPINVLGRTQGRP